MDLFRYVIELWRFWVGLFPANDVLGSKVNTAAVALVALIGIAGWLIGLAFGRDTGVR